MCKSESEQITREIKLLSPSVNFRSFSQLCLVSVMDEVRMDLTGRKTAAAAKAKLQ